MAEANLDLLVQAYLRIARRMNASAAGTGLTWLTELHQKALTAVSCGDNFVTSTTMEGESATEERRMSSQLLLQICESALQILATDPTDASAIPDPNAIRGSDFSSRMCIV